APDGGRPRRHRGHASDVEQHDLPDDGQQHRLRPRRAHGGTEVDVRCEDRSDDAAPYVLRHAQPRARALGRQDHPRGPTPPAANDARLLALDAISGKELWRSKIADINQYYSLTIAPRIAGDKVLIGVG